MKMHANVVIAVLLLALVSTVHSEEVIEIELDPERVAALKQKLSNRFDDDMVKVWVDVWAIRHVVDGQEIITAFAEVQRGGFGRATGHCSGTTHSDPNRLAEDAVSNLLQQHQSSLTLEAPLTGASFYPYFSTHFIDIDAHCIALYNI